MTSSTNVKLRTLLWADPRRQLVDLIRAQFFGGVFFALMRLAVAFRLCVELPEAGSIDVVGAETDDGSRAIETGEGERSALSRFLGSFAGSGFPKRSSSVPKIAAMTTA